MLTPEQVRLVEQRLSEGIGPSRIAKEIGCDRATVYRVRDRLHEEGSPPPPGSGAAKDVSKAPVDLAALRERAKALAVAEHIRAVQERANAVLNDEDRDWTYAEVAELRALSQYCDTARQAAPRLSVEDAEKLLRDVEGRYEKVTKEPANRKHLENYVRRLNAQVSDLKGEVGRQQAALASFRQQEAGVKERTAAERERLEKLKGQVKDVETLLGKHMTLKDLNEAIPRVEAKYAQLRSGLQGIEDFAALTARNAELAREVAGKEEEARKLDSYVADRNGMVRDLADIADNVRDQIGHLLERRSALTAEVGSSESRAHELKGVVQVLERVISDRQERVASLERRVAELQRADAAAVDRVSKVVDRVLPPEKIRAFEGKIEAAILAGQEAKRVPPTTGAERVAAVVEGARRVTAPPPPPGGEKDEYLETMKAHHEKRVVQTDKALNLADRVSKSLDEKADKILDMWVHDAKGGEAPPGRRPPPIPDTTTPAAR